MFFLEYILNDLLSIGRLTCIIVLQISPPITDKNLGVYEKSGEWGAHSMSHFLLISLFRNRSLSQSRVGFDVWGCPVLWEPLFIAINHSASSEWCPELPQNCHITFHIQRLSPFIFVFKPIWTDYPMFENGFLVRIKMLHKSYVIIKVLHCTRISKLLKPIQKFCFWWSI